MRLTRRGYAVVGVLLLSIVLAWQFGARSLNAIVAPGVIALGLGLIQAYRAERPTVERVLPAAGFPGEERTMRLHIETRGTVVVREQLGTGVSPSEVVRTIPGSSTVAYDITLRERGAHPLPPATVTVRDVLGLVEKPYTAGGRGELLVYPRIIPVTSPGPLGGLVDREGSPDRQAFDTVREYVPGDALRDIHWKTSAKYDDLIVMEFAAEDEGGVSIACEADADASDASADAMATAVASVATFLLEQGIEVSLVAPNGTVDTGVGDEHRVAILELLATAPAGHVPSDAIEAADIYITASGGTASLDIRGRHTDFAALSADPRTQEVAA